MDAMIRRTHPRKHKRGTTLIELMVAMVILSIGLLGMLAMQIEAMKSSRVGRHVTEAAHVGQSQMEALQSQAWALTAPTGGFTAPVAVNSVEAARAGAGAGAPTPQIFNVSWRVTNGPPTGAPPVVKLRTIDVRVTWAEPNDTPNMPLRRYAASSQRYNP